MQLSFVPVEQTEQAFPRESRPQHRFDRRNQVVAVRETDLNFVAGKPHVDIEKSPGVFEATPVKTGLDGLTVEIALEGVSEGTTLRQLGPARPRGRPGKWWCLKKQTAHENGCRIRRPLLRRSPCVTSRSTPPSPPLQRPLPAEVEDLLVLNDTNSDNVYVNIRGDLLNLRLSLPESAIAGEAVYCLPN